MQGPDLRVLVIDQKHAANVVESLRGAGVPFYSKPVFVRGGGKPRTSITFFAADEQLVTQLTAATGYQRPRDTLDLMYILEQMFGQDIRNILEQVHAPDSIMRSNKSLIDVEIRTLVTKMEHAKDIVGEDVLYSINYHGKKVSTIIRDMRQFLDHWELV